MNSHNNLSSSCFDLTVNHQEIDEISTLKTTQNSLAVFFLTPKKLLTKLLDALAMRSEPKIIQKCDRNGHIFWNVYDPITGYFGRLNSELEVRCWIEQRYSLNPIIYHHQDSQSYF